MGNEKVIRLDEEGRKLLVKFFRDFGLDGWIDDIKVRRYNQRDGVVTYGVKLRGFTGGNIDVEVPVIFDISERKLKPPVICFIDGRAFLLNESLLSDIMNGVNLRKRNYLGWMDVDGVYGVGFYTIQNPANKYGNRERENVRLSFDLNRFASKRMVEVAFSRELSRNDLERMNLNFGARLGFIFLRKAKNGYMGETVRPEIYRGIIFCSADELLELIKLYRLIKFAYEKMNDRWIWRVVEPYYLWKTRDGDIVLVGWDYIGNDWRDYDIGKVMDIGIRYDKEWIELERFVNLLEYLRGIKGNRRFQLEKPYYENLVQIRGNICKMGKRFKGLAAELLNRLDYGFSLYEGSS